MHMIATTTADALSISDAAILKKAPSSIPICLDLVEEPTASSWTPDNTFLYISSSHKVHRYDPASNCLKDVYSHNTGRISQLVAKGNKTVIFSSEEAVYTLECDPEPTISQTYTSHKNSITSLSLSNDNTLLASTSNAAVHVHNLALGSLTSMRSLPNHNINTCVFHPHSRTRLLVGAGRQLLVYDTTRPSSPLKTVVLNDAGAEDISAVACSPFSKTLVAIACSNGLVGLVDLEKEKALFRVLNLKATLTTIEFSPEGAAIYLGTDTGKIMVVDLRALDKPSKGITLSNHGSPIQTISVQKKARSSSDTTVKTPASHSTQLKKTPSENLPPPRRPASSTVPQGSKSASKTVSSPARARAGVVTSPVARRSSSLKDGPGGTPTRRPREGKQVLSPVRDPLGNSASSRNLADELADRKRGKAKEVDIDAKPLSSTTRAKRSPSPRRNATISATRVSTRPLDAENPRRARTLPSSSSASVVASRTRKSSNAGIITSVSDGEHLVNAHTAATTTAPRSSPVARRQRTVSSASRASAVSSNTKTTTTASMTSRPSSSASRPGSSLTSATTQPSSSSAASSPTSAAVRGFDLKSFALLRGEMSRTPSPDMPTLHASGDAGMGVGDPLTPVPMSKQQQKKKSMSVLGMGTPEVNRWVQAGKEGKVDKGKGKTVGFEDDEDRLLCVGGDVDEVEEEEQRLMKERERTLSLQISPQRPLRIPSTQSTTSHAGSFPIGSLSPNMPIDLSPGHTGTAAAAAAGSAQDLLKTIVQDVMFDFQRETKAEMMGLHLDLLRMGRSWKAELRQLMEEYVGDLRDLREENQRLRVENERLRRGF